ncbi:MAG: hypothetical protein AAF378_14840 [Cyanobacteria bacterium P01_A01_bin.84]
MQSYKLLKLIFSVIVIGDNTKGAIASFSFRLRKFLKQKSHTINPLNLNISAQLYHSDRVLTQEECNQLYISEYIFKYIFKYAVEFHILSSSNRS